MSNVKTIVDIAYDILSWSHLSTCNQDIYMLPGIFRGFGISSVYTYYWHQGTQVSFADIGIFLIFMSM